jgi:carboxypeptidase Taq
MNDDFTTLKNRLGEISDLRRVGSLLFWDQQTMMPRRAVSGRAEQLATLNRMAHELFVSGETGRLLDALQGDEESVDPESDEASLIRVTRRDYEKASRVPSDLRAEMTRAASKGLEAWHEAKSKSDFALFLPALERNVELKRRYIECFDPVAEPYDILLDDYERGMTTAEVREIFDELKAELVPLVRDIAERDDPSLAEVVEGDFDPDEQRALCHEIVNEFGYREATWRLDPTAHPFASGGGINDIRITTFYYPNNLDSIFATMHEYGHGLYEHQVDSALERTPLGSGVSLGLHESQSRMWENLVGRSLPFWRGFYPRVQERFPGELGAVGVERFYAAINRVHPSLIRIHADEVTYNMHVILRFELEQEIVNGRIDLRDLPEAWNAKVDEYLGLEVPNDAEGVLQDVHWSGGSIGYFSTYSLGNVMSLQIWERVLDEIPDLYDSIEHGEFEELKDWLRERLHRHGRKFTPKETLARIVGGPIDAGPYLRYLKEKHGAAATA